MRLKDVVELVNEKTDRVDRPYVALENIVSWEAKFVATNAVTEGTNACFKAGDVLFGKLRPYLAKGYLPDYDGICSTEFLVMRPRRDINGRYILYWMLSPDFIGVIKNRVAGVKMPRTDWATISQMELTLPGLDSQRKIVAYLDEKSAAIDARVAVLEKKLVAYKRLKTSIINRAVTRGLDPKAKLKDSGVEWIGKVPVGWDVVKVESYYDVQLGKMLSAKQSDASEIILEYVCAANVHYDGVSLNGLKQMWYLPREIETFRVKSGDLLVVEGGAGAGGCSVVENVDRVVCMQNSILRIRPTSTGSNRFLNYWFNDLGHRGYIGCACNVATIPHFTKEKMRLTPMPYPPPAEQIAIADYLDSKCAKIDKMAELVTREIELYKKLKRSLINEVVTWKRPVFADKPLRRSKEVA